MRRLRLIALAIMAVAAVTAISASAASAFTEFTPVGAKTTAKQNGEQVLEATESGGLKTTIAVKCTELTGSGEVNTATESSGEVAYKACKLAGTGVEVTNKCKFIFHISGLVDISPAGCEIKILDKTTKCEILIKGAQLGLKEVTYANIKTTAPLESEIKANVKGIAFSTAEGKACGFSTGGAVTGTSVYKGNSIVTGANVK